MGTPDRPHEEATSLRWPIAARGPIEREEPARHAWGDRVSTTLYWSGALAFAAVYVHVHSLAAYTLPVPWPDESDFMWQALAFGKHSSLYAPQLDLQRSYFWGPPGYMVFMGTLFKLIGFSFGRARFVSATLITSGFLFLAWSVAAYRFRTFSLLFCGMFLLSAPTIASGNIARMEALLLCIVCAGALLLQRGMYYKGLALLLASPLVHPNGVYFLASGAAYVAVTWRNRPWRLRLNRSDWIAAGAALILWAALLLYVATHWADVQHFTAGQLQRKFGRDIWTQGFGGGNAWFILIATACLICGLVTKLDEIFLLVLAIPAWMASAVGLELWYRIFNHLAYALLSIVFLHIAIHLAGRIRQSDFLQYVSGAVVAAALIGWNYQGGRIESPQNYPWSLQFGAMRLSPDFAYVTSTDVIAVRSFIDSLRALKQPVRIWFYPEADSLFFYDEDRGEVSLVQRTITSMDADVHFIHRSRFLPHWMNQQALSELGGSDAAAEPTILIRRDRTEFWYYRFAHTKPPTRGMPADVGRQSALSR